ncbi:MAG TPA: hypothetical protein VJN41_07570 [Alphaproteobacteria bacterium]|nr:hypothetical protein [Alphaproteobacteria bacterium]
MSARKDPVAVVPDALALIAAFREGAPEAAAQAFEGTLLVHSIEIARAARRIACVRVATDSTRVGRLAREHGAEVSPLGGLKEARGGGDMAWAARILRDLDAVGGLPPYCVLLRAEHPLPGPAWLDRALDILAAEPSLDGVKGVVPLGSTALWRRGANGALVPLPAQDCAGAYREHPALGVFRSRSLIEHGPGREARLFGLVMPAPAEGIARDADAELMAALSAPGPFVLVIDIDGVIAVKTPENDYRKARPIVDNIGIVNALFEAGHRIVLFTGRGSRTGTDWRAFTRVQLADWGVRYHELIFGKPAGDCFVDDKHVSLGALKRLLLPPKR